MSASKGSNATLVSITRPEFDLDEGKWLPLPNELLRGKWPVKLSALEHAILCALLSLPPESPWDNVREWVYKLPFEDSAGARAKALTGLERKGYLTRKRYSMGRGKFRYEWSVTAEPKVSAGRITSPLSRDESTRHDNEPILEDGPIKDGPSKDGPVTSTTSTPALARGVSGTKGEESSRPAGGLPGLLTPERRDEIRRMVEKEKARQAAEAAANQATHQLVPDSTPVPSVQCEPSWVGSPSTRSNLRVLSPCDRHPERTGKIDGVGARYCQECAPHLWNVA